MENLKLAVKALNTDQPKEWPKYLTLYLTGSLKSQDQILRLTSPLFITIELYSLVLIESSGLFTEESFPKDKDQCRH